jgi:hypothetical protein
MHDRATVRPQLVFPTREVPRIQAMSPATRSLRLSRLPLRPRHQIRLFSRRPVGDNRDAVIGNLLPPHVAQSLAGLTADWNTPINRRILTIYRCEF